MRWDLCWLLEHWNILLEGMLRLYLCDLDHGNAVRLAPKRMAALISGVLPLSISSMKEERAGRRALHPLPALQALG